MRRALAIAAASALLAGCGGSTGGRGLFAASCSRCHSLIGNESLRRQGGDLLGFRFSRGVWLQYAREMPVPHPLSRAQLTAIVDYILEVQGRT